MNTKSRITLSVWSALLAALVLLAACTAKTTATTTEKYSTVLPADYTNALPADLQLAVGTLKLEGTANQIDAATAQNLLPLWRAMSTLSASDATAKEELTSVLKQIKAAMTPAQVEAITAMKLTTSDLGQRGPAPSGTVTASGTPQPGGEGMPPDAAGGPPAGGGDRPQGGGGGGGQQGGKSGTGGSQQGGQSGTGGSQRTAAERNAAQNFANQANSTKTTTQSNSNVMMYNMVVQMLQRKVQQGQQTQPGN
jgi:uncharacterized membrane protein YgcG